MDTVLAGEAFEAMPVPMVALEGPEHRLVAANAAYRALAGRDDFYGLTGREVFPEIAGQQLFVLLDRVWASREAFRAQEWRIQIDLPDGPAEFYMDFSLTPWRAADGTMRGLLVTQEDVTARVRRRQEQERRASEVERDLSAARDVVATLQAALLPTGLPVLPDVEASASYLVAAHDQAAGGDWFDVTARPDGTVALVVGDVVGHGVEASATMGQARAVLGELLAGDAELPALLGRLDAMTARVPGLRGATVCAAVIHPESRAVRYATCGHPAPLLVRSDGSCVVLAPTGGRPLGTGAPVGVREEALAEGDLVILYSDGLVERPGRPLEEGQRVLATVAGEAARDRVMPIGSSASTAERVCGTAVELMTREGYDDDVTVVVAGARVTPVPVLELVLPARVAAVRRVHEALLEWLVALDVTDDDRRGLDLAVAELVANAVEHAYPADAVDPEVAVHVTLSAGGIVVATVTDHGRWRPPVDPGPTRGRGLWFAQEATDGLELDRGETGTTATVTCRVRRAAHASPRGAARAAVSERAFEVVTASESPRVVTVRGCVDVASAARFRDHLASAGRGGFRPLTVDLDGVDLLASVGVQALVSAADDHARHDAPLTLVAGDGSPAAFVLDLVGLSRTAPSDDR